MQSKTKSTKNKYKSLSKNVALFTVSSFGSKIIAFLLVPLYTSILSTEEYGTADLILETVSLLIPILTIDIQDAVLRFTIGNGDKKNTISIGINISLIGFAILAPVLVVLKAIGILKLEPILIGFLLLNYLFGALNNVFTLYLKGVDKVSTIMVAGILNTAVMCLSNVVLLVFFKCGLYGYLLAHTAGILVSVVFQLFNGGIYKNYIWKTDTTLAKEMVAYSSPLVTNVLAWWINGASDRYILTYICGIAVNGIYSISYKIPSILSVVQNVFYNAWSISAITEYDRDDKDGFIGNVYTSYSIMSILACSVIMVLNIPIANVLYPNSFFTAWKYVPFLLIGTVFNGIALFQGCIFTAIKKTSIISRTTLIGAGINTLGNIILIKAWGALGAASATMVGYFFTWVMRSVYLKNYIRMRVNWKKHYMTLALLVVQSMLAVFVQGYWQQLLCMALIIGLYLNEIKRIVLKVASEIYGRLTKDKIHK